MNKTQALLKLVINEEQDFEWYPTTTAIIDAIKNDITESDVFHRHENPSVLDCGAGDGRVLKALTKSTKYAIEKSKPLIRSLDRDIYIVGTDFHQQTLIDKAVDVVFSNPPYSEFETWASKIIREANARVVYLVIPDRWEKSNVIKLALEDRGAKATIISNFDFLNADRKARVRVEVLRISLAYHNKDPFTLWFNTHFELEINTTESSKFDVFNRTKDKVREKISNELVEGNDCIQVLEKLYQRDMKALIDNYRRLESIDPVLLNELDVNVEGVIKALRLKIEHLKDVYWKEFFNHFDKICRRLTKNTREYILNHLTSHTHIDFNENNAYAIAIWVIKNANTYYDDQLITVFERLVSRTNIKKYKSNQRTFRDDKWRWHQKPANLERFGLEYRIIVEDIGGLCVSDWNCERKKYNGLSESAANFINDLRVIADNLGFSVKNYSSAADLEWTSNKKVIFLCEDEITQNKKNLMEVKAFYNGNLHIKFNQDFMCRFNVEFGRLKGWLRSYGDAVNELDISQSSAVNAFKCNLQLQETTILKLGFMNKPG